MRFLLFLFLLTTSLAQAQDYVDIFKFSFGQTFNNDFEGTPNSTQVTSVDVDFTVPVPISEKHTFITGAIYNQNYLQLFPQAEFTRLHSTALKLGIASTYSEKWSSTFVLLPKIASDYGNITGDDFYLGGFGVVKYQKKENLIYRFGAYGSQEAFGFFTTPIFGWYYLSDSKTFEMDMSLPISADMNYRFTNFSLGIDYFGIGRSFNLTKQDTPDVYVDVSSLEFASYIQFNTLNNTVLLRGKFGYSSNNFEVYNQGETIDLGLSAFAFGDDRTLLNPVIGGSLFFRLEAIYRFHLVKEKKE